MKELEDAGFVLRSSYRRAVFVLIDKLIMPSQIQKQLDIRLTHITRELTALKNRKLIECINEKEKVGRLYHLTDKGMKLKMSMLKEGLL